MYGHEYGCISCLCRWIWPRKRTYTHTGALQARVRMAGRVARAAPLLLLLLAGYASTDDPDVLSQTNALMQEAGNHGAAMAQRGQTEEAARAFRLAVRLQPTLWQAHFELGKALLRTCQFARALAAFASALAHLIQQGGSAQHEAAVLMAQATSALPLAKVATSCTRQQQLLELVAAALERAFTLVPDPASPIAAAMRNARGAGGLRELLLISSGGECVQRLHATAAVAASQGRTQDSVVALNRARQIDPDSPENFRLLREAIQREAEEKRAQAAPRPLYVAGIRPAGGFQFFSQNGQDLWIFEKLVEPKLQVRPVCLLSHTTSVTPTRPGDPPYRAVLHALDLNCRPDRVVRDGSYERVRMRAHARRHT